jgi:hypothetical protein
MRRFFRSLGGRNLGLHFAQLAALDSGVCAILAAMRDGPLPLTTEPRIFRILEKIHHDEARHTASALRFARHLVPRERLFDEAHTVRSKLVDLIKLRADAMERLGVDADRLARRLTTPPNSFAR